MATSTHKTVRPHDCPDTCSILATVEDGRVTACAGDPEHPFTQGFLCHKVRRYPEWIYSPLRVLHPLLVSKRLPIWLVWIGRIADEIFDRIIG